MTIVNYYPVMELMTPVWVTLLLSSSVKKIGIR